MTRTASEIGKSNVQRSKTHERRVAKLLQEWSGTEFRRRRVEGRDLSTIARESTADAIATDKNFRFSVEAKCGRDFSLDALMASPKTARFTEWWFQTCYDAEILTKHAGLVIYPMLFFKPGVNWDWIAVSYNSIELLRDKSDQQHHEFWFNVLRFNYGNIPIQGNISHSKKHPVLIERVLPDPVICRWKSFADSVGTAGLFFE